MRSQQSPRTPLQPYSDGLPDARMHGFQATREIRGQEGPNQDIPIIALTANVVCGIDGDCGECGMNDILNKPVQLDRMGSIIDKWLKIAAKTV